MDYRLPVYALLTVGAAWLVVECLRTGSFSFKSLQATRAGNPIGFWAGTAALGCVVLIGLYWTAVLASAALSD